MYDQNHEADKYKISLNHMDWSFPVGLAAGLDKNAEAIDFFSRILFGAVEIGTVTPKPQDGNPKPRMFRYIEEQSLRNKMGFNNAGAEEILQNVLASNRNGKVLGVNLGKNKVTPEELAPLDYLTLYEKFWKVADYLVVNVSSPNTPGLRDLQRKDKLDDIFKALEDVRKKCHKPLYLKISPDLALEDLDPVINSVKEYNLSGIIATNTTIVPSLGDGGVSGRLLLDKSRIMRNAILEKVKETPSIDVIGVGGISCFDDLLDFWKAGGKAAQIYTSFIFQGPSILTNMKKDIDKFLAHYDFKNLEEALKNISHLD